MACHHCHHEHCGVEEHHEEKEEKLSMYLYGIGILFLVLSLIPIFTEFRVVFVVLAILLSGYELLLNGINAIEVSNVNEITEKKTKFIKKIPKYDVPIQICIRLGENERSLIV